MEGCLDITCLIAVFPLMMWVWLCASHDATARALLLFLQHITGIPPEGLTAEEIEKMRKKFGVSFKFSKFVLDDRPGVSEGEW